eukprot:CAMPEP_0194291250 /NCGR_PEP_ID=MMETSP0169-20130528/43065_1 /TAXON_ID=218684 /ORGANISM="Corethron pennatum, Strain L29A3" /LENGTH=193 /DNA_ID=CAMNT_0039039077 /DNA_START=100 /DNA_END=677 /DNA_ORIENTATION=-
MPSVPPVLRAVSPSGPNPWGRARFPPLLWLVALTHRTYSASAFFALFQRRPAARKILRRPAAPPLRISAGPSSLAAVRIDVGPEGYYDDYIEEPPPFLILADPADYGEPPDDPGWGVGRGDDDDGPTPGRTPPEKDASPVPPDVTGEAPAASPTGDASASRINPSADVAVSPVPPVRSGGGAPAGEAPDRSPG